MDSRWVQTMNKLSALGVSKISKQGRYSDGGGLYLLVGPTGGKSWIFRYKVASRERVMGLGPFPDVLLAEARIKAAECRRLRVENVDPLEIKNQERLKRQIAERGQTSFRDCAEAYVKLHEVSWRNPKHRLQWRNTLATYVYPFIGDAAIAKIDVPDVLEVLEPIWLTKPETASRIRGRLEAVLDWAKVKKMREG